MALVYLFAAGSESLPADDRLPVVSSQVHRSSGPGAAKSAVSYAPDAGDDSGFLSGIFEFLFIAAYMNSEAQYEHFLMIFMLLPHRTL